MSQIFISSASEDMDYAKRLADAFAGQGWSVWWDKQIPRKPAYLFHLGRKPV